MMLKVQAELTIRVVAMLVLGAAGCAGGDTGLEEITQGSYEETVTCQDRKSTNCTVTQSAGGFDANGNPCVYTYLPSGGTGRYCIHHVTGSGPIWRCGPGGTETNPCPTCPEKQCSGCANPNWEVCNLRCAGSDQCLFYSTPPSGYSKCTAWSYTCISA
jgi:hypothetical protein